MMWLASTGNVILAKGFLRFHGWRSLPGPAKSETGRVGRGAPGYPGPHQGRCPEPAKGSGPGTIHFGLCQRRADRASRSASRTAQWQIAKGLALCRGPGGKPLAVEGSALALPYPGAPMRRPSRRGVRAALDAAAIPTWSGPRDAAATAEALQFVARRAGCRAAAGFTRSATSMAARRNWNDLHQRDRRDLARAADRPAPLLVHLGDYIDQGPDSAGVIELLVAHAAADPARSTCWATTSGCCSMRWTATGPRRPTGCGPAGRRRWQVGRSIPTCRARSGRPRCPPLMWRSCAA